MKNVSLIARREFITYLTKKATIVATVIVAVFLIAGGVVYQMVIAGGTGEPKTTNIGVASSLDGLSVALETIGKSSNKPIAVVPLEEGQADEALQGGKVDAWVGKVGEAIILRFAKPPADPVITQIVSGAAQSRTISAKITELGGSPQDMLNALAKSAPQLEFAQQRSTPFDLSAFLTGVVIITLLFTGIMVSGQLIAVGVVEEKSSRVVEILLASVRPRDLLAGKVLGIGLFALLQLIIFGALAVGVAWWSGLLKGLTIPIGPPIAWGVGWFLIGYFMYVVLWGALASMVSRQEDIGAVTTPFVLFLFVPFYTAMYFVPSYSEATVTKVLSLAPFMSPFLMPIRQSISQVSGWELGIALAVSAATVVCAILLAGRIYRRSILHTGSRVTFRQVFTKSA